MPWDTLADVITCRLYRDGKVAEEGFDPSRVSDLLEEKGTLIWLDLEQPTDTELTTIQEEFALHPLAMEDVRHRHQRPKVEVYDDYFFLVLYGVEWAEPELNRHEVHVFVGTGYLITIRYPPALDLQQVERRWQRQAELTREGGGFLLYALLDEVVDGYFEVVDRFEDASEDVEEQVFGDEAGPEVQERIFHLKKQVLQFRRLVMPLREVLDLLNEEVGLVTPALGAYYRDVADHVVRTLEFIDNVRELLTTALEAHLSQVSNRLNDIMKKLTSWAGIILVPTLIAGIYGMNFRYMPELLWRYGYYFALGLMLVSGLVLYRVFKKRNWL